MKVIPLANTGRKTTELGFGRAALPRGSSDQAMRLLDAAFDAGIRHFDVAPSYSDGAAEGYVGRFLTRHAGETTVPTKYGILPSAMRPPYIRVAREVFGPLLRALRRIPMAKTALAKSASAMNVSSKAAFSPTQAKASLEHSLRQLGLDKVDLFLMHEATVTDLADEGLLDLLHDSVATNRIGAFGIVGKSSRIPSLLSERPAFCDVLQFDWTVFRPIMISKDVFRIHYWVFSQQLQSLHKSFMDQTELRRRWSDTVNMDLGNVQELAAVMLKAALVRCPDSIVLFASSNPANISRNVRVAENAALEYNALRFCELAATEGAALSG
jgi:D-threo-aldose 1-dehydrogenase